MKKILLFSLIAFLFSNTTFAEQSKITLEHVSKSEDGNHVYKHYKSENSFTVDYFYGQEVVGDSTYETILNVRFKEDTEDLIPVDVMKTGFIVAGDLDLNVRKLGINSNPPQGCDYTGEAVIRLNKMMLGIPEYPAGIDYSAKIAEVISFTKPKLVCNP